jgi:hypothetical protein
MLTLPRTGLLFATCACLAITLSIIVLPADLFWACAAPERYLTGAREFVGPSYISDDLSDTRTPPSAVIAWRRLAAARDIAAFERLLDARGPAARLYGLAGLRRIAPAFAERGVTRLRGVADNVYVNWACAERRMPLAAAVNELDVRGWADTLSFSRGGCR